MVRKTILILLLYASLLCPATIEITTWAELQAVNSDRAGDYKLMNDLDKESVGYATYNSGDGFRPLGSDGGAPLGLGFRGSFDGNGKTIADLRCQRGVQNYAGVFGYINNIGKSIINLNIKAVDIYSNGANIFTGAFAGYIEGAVVSGVTTSGVVNNPSGAPGGFSGRIKNSTVSDCASHCDVSGYQFVYGFSGAETSTLSRCISTGAVSVTEAPSYGFGNKSGGTWTDVFWDTQTSGVSAGAGQGGTGKTTAEMKDIDTYANFDIALIGSHTTETWFIDDGNDYPRLYYEKSTGTVTRARVMMGEDELMCLY